MSEIPAAAPICEHYWAWVSPAGARNSARICMTCHQPDPKWLNEARAFEDAVENVRQLCRENTFIPTDSQMTTPVLHVAMVLHAIEPALTTHPDDATNASSTQPEGETP